MVCSSIQCWTLFHPWVSSWSPKTGILWSKSLALTLLHTYAPHMPWIRRTTSYRQYIHSPWSKLKQAMCGIESAGNVCLKTKWKLQQNGGTMHFARCSFPSMPHCSWTWGSWIRASFVRSIDLLFSLLLISVGIDLRRRILMEFSFHFIQGFVSWLGWIVGLERNPHWNLPARST